MLPSVLQVRPDVALLCATGIPPQWRGCPACHRGGPSAAVQKPPAFRCGRDCAGPMSEGSRHSDDAQPQPPDSAVAWTTRSPRHRDCLPRVCRNETRSPRLSQSANRPERIRVGAAKSDRHPTSHNLRPAMRLQFRRRPPRRNTPAAVSGTRCSHALKAESSRMDGERDPVRIIGGSADKQDTIPTSGISPLSSVASAADGSQR